MPVSNDQTNAITALMSQYASTDPRLFEAITLITKNISDINKDIYDQREIARRPKVTDASLVPPTFNTPIVHPTTIELSWPPVAKPYGIIYEISLNGKFLLQTPLNTIQVPPAGGLIIGSHIDFQFFIKSVNSNGASSITSDVIVEVDPVTVVLAGQIVNNTVILSWSVPTPSNQFLVDYFGVTSDSPNPVPTPVIRDHFISIVEPVGGTYTYTVRPVDIAGNLGVASTITLVVPSDPSYVLHTVQSIVFGGPPVIIDSLIFPVDASLTVAQHFDSHGWTTIQNQIDAGYPYYAQPGNLSYQYTGTIDFGGIFHNALINVLTDFETIFGRVGIRRVYIQTSQDGSTYTPFVEAPALLSAAFRYVFVLADIEAENAASFGYLIDIKVSLDLKKESDSGVATCHASDPFGTFVSFNKSFKDVSSINLTVQSNVPRHAVYSYADQANNTLFGILVFDKDGNRVDGIVSWQATGVL